MRFVEKREKCMCARREKKEEKREERGWEKVKQREGKKREQKNCACNTQNKWAVVMIE